MLREAVRFGEFVRFPCNCKQNVLLAGVARWLQNIVLWKSGAGGDAASAMCQPKVWPLQYACQLFT